METIEELTKEIIKVEQKKIEILKAYIEGKVIRKYYKGREDLGAICFSIDDKTLPEWDFEKFDYYIKPEPPGPKYVPYENAEEFMQAMRQHGNYLIEDERAYVLCILLVFGNGVQLYDFPNINHMSTHTFEDLFAHYCWTDAEPCGKLKQ